MKFKVGEKVRVREWNDLAKEFGYVPGFGNDIIDAPLVFGSGMKEHCGKIVTISVCDIDCTYQIEEDKTCWYAEEVLEPVEEEEEEEEEMVIMSFVTNDRGRSCKHCFEEIKKGDTMLFFESTIVNGADYLLCEKCAKKLYGVLKEHFGGI